MAKIVLARPPLASAAERRWAQIAPLGLAYLASAVRATGAGVEIVDGKIGGFTSITDHARAIASNHPDYVGISSMTVDYRRAAELAAAIKVLCGATTILGGAHANALPERSLLEAPGFDYVIAGEGERSLVELIAACQGQNSLNSIPGLYGRGRSGVICMGPPPGYDTDVQDLLFPAWDLFPKMNFYPVMWERGCPYGCVFCSRNMSKKVRGRSVEQVFKEISWIVETFSPRVISFQDETFGTDAETTLDLLKSLHTLHRKSGIRFTAQTRVDTISEPIARAMAQAGFTFLELGVESGNVDVLARSGKGITLDQVEKAVQVARKSGLKVWLKFILGLPGETDDSIRDTIKLATRLQPHRISLSIIVAYPGSKIFSMAEEGQMGYRLLTRKWDQFDKYLSCSVELENLSYDKLRIWQIVGYLCVYLLGGRFFELLRSVWIGSSFILNSILAKKQRTDSSQ